MSTLKVNTVESATTPTVLISDGLSVSGVSTLSGGLKVGTAVTISDNGNFGITGIMTATSFTGSGANLTSLPAANLTGSLPAISGASLTGIAGGITDFESTYNCVITPTRSDSKILVEMSMHLSLSVDSNIIMARLRKKVASGSFADVDGALGAAADSRYRCTAVTFGRYNQYSVFPLHIKYLDSPATTSALTYSVSVAHDSGSSRTIYLNRGANDTSSYAYVPRSISTITLTEITG